MTKDSLKKIFFPYPKIRKVQEDLVNDVQEAIRKKSSLIAHAPTGLGKTAATLAPAIAETIEKKEITIFFLTSRHTQHTIVIKTLKEIRDKYKINFGAVSIIGKKWMCAIPDTETLYSKDFISFCKAMRDDNKCEFYANIGSKSKPSVVCRKVVERLSAISPVSTSKIISVCGDEKLCPYELSLQLASSSKIIVTDYYYLLDPFIRDIFLKRTGKELGSSIIIFDEAHNLPSRVRALMTSRLTTTMVERAIKEAHKYRFEEAELYLKEIKEMLFRISSEMKENGERLISKEELTAEISRIKDYDEISAALEFAADEVRETERASYIGSVALFMDLWPGDDEGYVRILSKGNSKYGEFASVTYRCLDPSIFTKSLIESSYSTILMSGTLTPTPMYRDLLGFPEDTIERSYSSPFPKKNKLVMVVPKTTTKFTKRSEEQYKEIASVCSEILDEIPGNAAVFFPSYNIRDEVMQNMHSCKKTFFAEKSKMSKEDRHTFLDEFKEEKNAVLMGVASGSFGEGVDIPDNILKGVIVVGLPLQRPDLETKELIKYYDEKFNKGWDYGYTMPAITKALQNAGRCIRSEKDKAVMVFLDERYSWPSYIKCFPDDWDIKITVDYCKEIKDFFS